MAIQVRFGTLACSVLFWLLLLVPGKAQDPFIQYAPYFWLYYNAGWYHDNIGQMPQGIGTRSQDIGDVAGATHANLEAIAPIFTAGARLEALRQYSINSQPFMHAAIGGPMWYFYEGFDNDLLAANWGMRNPVRDVPQPVTGAAIDSLTYVDTLLRGTPVEGRFRGSVYRAADLRGPGFATNYMDYDVGTYFTNTTLMSTSASPYVSGEFLMRRSAASARTSADLSNLNAYSPTRTFFEIAGYSGVNITGYTQERQAEVLFSRDRIFRLDAKRQTSLGNSIDLTEVKQIRAGGILREITTGNIVNEYRAMSRKVNSGLLGRR